MLRADPKHWRALAVLGIAYLQRMASGYALTFGGLLVLGSRPGDLHGRCKVFMTGFALFSLSSLDCGLSTSPGMLVAFLGWAALSAVFLGHRASLSLAARSPGHLPPSHAGRRHGQGGGACLRPHHHKPAGWGLSASPS